MTNNPFKVGDIVKLNEDADGISKDESLIVTIISNDFLMFSGNDWVWNYRGFKLIDRASRKGASFDLTPNLM